MPFECARCILCGDYAFEIAKVVAFRFKAIGEPGPKMQVVDLDGRAPWSGIRCICTECAAVVEQSGTSPSRTATT